MKKYLFQRFLPNCDTSKINLFELYSDNVENMQVVSVSLLDEIIDTEEDLSTFLNQYKPTGRLILDDDRPTFSNIILKEYAKKTIKSYLVWFTLLGEEQHILLLQIRANRETQIAPHFCFRH